MHVDVARTRQDAFTLIELLVVIAIIAILAAMLMPALERARQMATRVACLNSMKQQALGAQMYANSFDGYLPGVEYDWSRDYAQFLWRRYNKANFNGPLGAGLLYREGFVQSPDLFFCPGRTDGERYTKDYGQSGWERFGNNTCESSYYLATTNRAPNENLDYSTSHHMAKADSGKVLQFEVCILSHGTTDPDPWYADWYPYGAARHGHGNGYNMTFFDSSGRWVEDPQNYLENTFYGHTLLKPWTYNDSCGVYYIHTEMLGWSGQRFHDAWDPLQ